MNDIDILTAAVGLRILAEATESNERHIADALTGMLWDEETAGKIKEVIDQ